VGVDDSFFDLGGDSLLAMRVVAAINKRLDTKLAVRTLFHTPSVRSLSQELGSFASEVEVVPIEVLQEGAGVPLFCIHPGGGMSWPYQRLNSYLDCPIIGIQQSLRAEETEPQSIRELAKNYADRIQGLHPDGPYNVLGWSFGGVVAHELAIELQRRGCVVPRLILLDAQPNVEDGVTERNRAAVELDTLEEALRFYGIDIPERGGSLTDEELDELIRERITTEFPRQKELLDWLVHNLDSNKALQQAHEPGVLQGDLTVFSAVRDGGDRSSSALQQWRPYVAGEITEHSIDCTHEEMLTAESLRLYGRQLQFSLEG
jgi:thioesterase domain-containing protein